MGTRKRTQKKTTSKGAPTARRRNAPTRKNADVAASELAESATTLVRHLGRDRSRMRARLLGELFAAVMGDAAPVALRALSTPRVAKATAIKEGLAHIASTLWRRLVQLEQLTPERALPIATRLAPLLRSPVQLFFFEHEARELGLEHAARAYAAELDRAFPDFRHSRHELKIDRALLDGADLDLTGLAARFHENGHLAALSAGKDGPRLELAPQPGSGRFVQTGRRGGYGFHIDERYAQGSASGTFNSPWHDGSEYRESKEWLVWVVENIGELQAVVRRAAGAHAA